MKNLKFWKINLALFFVFLFFLFSFDFILDRISLREEAHIVNISEMPYAEHDLKFYIDRFEESYLQWKKMIYVEGWVLIQGQSLDSVKKYIVLQSDMRTYVFDTEARARPDLTNALKDGFNYDNNGFYTIISKDNLENGSYDLGILLEFEGGKKFVWTGKEINKNNNRIIYNEALPVKRAIPSATDNIRFFLDNLNISTNEILIRGWAFIKDQETANKKKFIVLRSNTKEYIYTTLLDLRPDLIAAFGSQKYDAGFIAKISKDEIQPGIYDIGVLISSKKSGSHFVWAEQKIEIP